MAAIIERNQAIVDAWKEADRMDAHDMLHRIALFTTEIRPVPGIYLLLNKDRVVYVGQSMDVCTRLGGHKAKGYTSMRMLEVQDAADRDQLERDLIVLLRPERNFTLKHRKIDRRLREQIGFCGKFS